MVVAEVYEGAPLSFMTRAAEELLLSVKTAATFVPATTRTQAQYERVALPGPLPEYAITSNGGVLLHHGVPDAAWNAQLTAHMAADCAPLEVIEAHLSKPEFAPWILRLRRAEDLLPTPSLTAMPCPSPSWRSLLNCVPRLAGVFRCRAASSTAFRTPSTRRRHWRKWHAERAPST
ncbi:hypothetical protein NHF46_21645 [Arthrobacter alpinus]|nr:hypothetical protein [Arthrobacter alpinus]